jgi:hypothetical protein
MPPLFSIISFHFRFCGADAILLMPPRRVYAPAADAAIDTPSIAIDFFDTPVISPIARHGHAAP